MKLKELAELLGVGLPPRLPEFNLNSESHDYVFAGYNAGKKLYDNLEIPIEKLRPSADKIQEVIDSSLDCPNCDNKGYTLEDNRNVITRDMALDGDCPESEGQLIGRVEQIQCEFCYTEKNSKFNLAQSIHNLKPGGE